MGLRDKTERKPRRAYGEGSLTQRKDGLWVGRIELEPATGPGGKPLRRRMEKASRSQRVVLDWMAKTKGEIATTGRSADPTITMRAWAAQWLTRKTHRARPGTVRAYRARIDTWILPAIGHKRLGKIAPADVRAVVDRMREAKQSPASMHATHTLLGAILGDAVRDGVLTDNPQRRVDAPRTFKTTRRAFTEDQTVAIVKAAAAAGETRAIAALLTGMRRSELLGLTWECVDLDAGQITVAWQLRDITYRHGCGAETDNGWPCGRRRGMHCPSGTTSVPDGLLARHVTGVWWLLPPKTDQIRSVPIDPVLGAALRKQQADTAGQPNPHGLVWHRANGSPVLPIEDAQVWRRIVVAAGLPASATTHWARHTVATLLMEKHVDAKVVGEILGHARIETTRGTYQHVSSELARAGMAKLGELVAGGPPSLPPAD